MSGRGVFAVDRGVWDHPTFKAEPFTEREAWIWIIGEAEWRDRSRRRGGTTVGLRRGQLAHSTRFMAAAWQWSEARVRRFLKRLKIDALINVDTDAGVTLITVCKYTQYQRVSLPTDAAIDAPSDAPATQQRRKPEDRESIEYSSPIGEAPMLFPAERVPSIHDRLWSEGMQILQRLTGRSDVRSLLGKLMKLSQDNPAVVMGAIEAASRDRKANPTEWLIKAVQSQAPRGSPGHQQRSSTAVAVSEALAKYR